LLESRWAVSSTGRAGDS